MPFQAAMKVTKPHGEGVAEVTEFCGHEHSSMDEALSCDFFTGRDSSWGPRKLWLAENGSIIDGPFEQR